MNSQQNDQRRKSGRRKKRGGRAIEQQQEQELNQIQDNIQNSNAPSQLQALMDVQSQANSQPIIQEINIDKEESKQPELQQDKFQNPILQQQNANVVQNFNSQRFLAKIPNMKVLRDFLTNSCGYYCPPMKDMNNLYCREILNGNKKLMKHKKVLYVDQVPNWPQFSAKQLWQKVKSNPNILQYFPNFTTSKLPQRFRKAFQYFQSSLGTNTIAPNSVIKAVQDAKIAKQKEMVEQQPILLTNEFANLFQQFSSITTDMQKKGLRLQKQKEYDQCPLCMQVMVRSTSKVNFQCLSKAIQQPMLIQFLVHHGHKQCVIRYLKSDNFKNGRYLCPMRCSQL